MKMLRMHIGGLYWQLALSYFLVTLVVVLMIIGTGTLLTHLHDFMPLGNDQVVSNQQALENASGSQQTASLHESASSLTQMASVQTIAPYLEQAVPDRKALQHWVIPSLLRGIYANTQGSVLSIAILDRHEKTVASLVCTDPAIALRNCQLSTVELASDPPLHSSFQTAILSVLSGSQHSYGVTSTTREGNELIALPVRAYDQHLLGVLVAVFSKPIDEPDNIRTGFSIFFASLAYQLLFPQSYFVLLAIVIGTLIGLRISHKLVLRLRRIMRAAEAWSRGEFQVTVPDTSRDELGQLAQDLNHMAEQLQTLLTTRQELAVVEERSRLARELHDSVKQHVFANTLLIRAARKVFAREPQVAQRYLLEAEELAGQTQQALIASIRALRPAALVDKGLVSVLREYASDWSQRMGIVVDMQIEGEHTTPQELETTLFRVVQEALTNVARHSHAPAVVIKLVWSDEQILLQVQDTGKGFAVQEVAGKGMGLAIMRERVDAQHGRLTISSTAYGTSIEAYFPLAGPHHKTAEVLYE